MLKTLIGGFALAAALALAPAASASDWYVKGEVGVTLDTQIEANGGGVELDDGQTFGAYVGTTAGPFRIEAGVSRIQADSNFFGIPVDASANDYNATAYLDTASGFYVGAGVDYIQAEATVANVFSVEQSGYGWHVSGGYAFRAADGIVETQVTYLDANLDDVDLSGVRATIGYRRAI